MLFETLGKVSDLTVQESKNPSEGVRLSGVFGVCGVKNQNNRIYDKANYAAMVESLQKVIATEGCPGELEHPNNFNINLENVSHKIESIEMNEDGTITGTILLLNTPKGKIAQAIVEGGLPLYISSRGAGTITNEGRVNLTSLKTYDLVGTPGFSQAKLTLKENQTVESLNESLDDGNIMWAIVEGDDSSDDLLDLDSDDKKSDDKKSDDKKSDDKKKEDKEEEKKSEEKSDDSEKEEKKKKDNKDNKDSKVTMEELKKSIDALADKVTTLEAQLHVAQESAQPNYNAIEMWIKEEFAPSFKNEVSESVKKYVNEEFANKVQNWICEEFANEINEWVENDVATELNENLKSYVNEEFAEHLQGWIVEEFGGQVDKWVTEEFGGQVDKWVSEEFAGTVENWIAEEYSTVVENWINDEYAPILENRINESVNENVAQYISENNAARLDEIDSLLETLSDDKNSAVAELVKETKAADKYANIYAVKNMPAEFVPSWNMIDEARKDEIVRSSKMYDFTKEGVLESFWGSVDFEKKQEVIKESKDIVADYHSNIFAQMMRLRK